MVNTLFTETEIKTNSGGRMEEKLEKQPLLHDKSKGRLFWREILLVSTVTILVLASATENSLQTIALPPEAESKGANPFEYGFIFSIYYLVYFISTPILGSRMHLLDLPNTMVFGLMLSGITTLLFGLTDHLSKAWTFLVVCAILRIFESIGASCIFMACTTFICSEYPKSTALYCGILESAWCFGNSLGPAIAAPFLDFGGFAAPYYFVGFLLILLTLLPSAIRDPTKLLTKAYEDLSEENSKFNFYMLLRIPSILLYAVIILEAGINISFILAMLDEHISQFNLTESQVGLVFLLPGMIPGITYPIWGGTADRMSKYPPGLLTLLGLLLHVFAFLMIGPATFIPLKSDILITVIGLAFFGFGLGAVALPSFIELLNSAKRNGFPDDKSTVGLVMGLNASVYCIGSFLGPLLGGYLVTNLSFPGATNFLVASNAMLAGILCVFLVCKATLGRREQQS